MTIGDRIKQVRQSLENSQSEFAAGIGIGQAALSAIEKGIRNVTDRNISLVCSEYRVNEQWLRSGFGEMFCKNDENVMSELASERNLSDLEQEFLRVYFRLNEDQKQSLKDFALFLKSQSDIDIEKGMINLSEKLKEEE